MCIAALYDIHGNLPALEAVLSEIREAGVDRVVVGGDVLPGPMPRECIATLFDLEVPVDFIHGNGETDILAVLSGAGPSVSVPEEFHEALRWVAQELSTDLGQVLEGWPLTHQIEVPGLGDVLFCHATPRNDTEIFTEITPEEGLRSIFEPLEADLVICGHTHMQFDRRIGGVRVVNAGSVGMAIGHTGADWLLIGADVELRHTSYDLAAAAERIRRTGYPQASAFAEDYVLSAPPKAKILELFERSAVS